MTSSTDHSVGVIVIHDVHRDTRLGLCSSLEAGLRAASARHSARLGRFVAPPHRRTHRSYRTSTCSPRRALKTCSPQRSAPASGFGSESSANHPTWRHSSGCALQLPTDRPALEDERVERDPGEAESQAVEDRDQPNGLGLDPGLLEHLFDDDLGGGVADVGPSGRVEPDTRVRPLHEEHLALVVADHGARPRPWA